MKNLQLILQRIGEIKRKIIFRIRIGRGRQFLNQKIQNSCFPKRLAHSCKNPPLPTPLAPSFSEPHSAASLPVSSQVFQFFRGILPHTLPYGRKL